MIDRPPFSRDFFANKGDRKDSDLCFAAYLAECTNRYRDGLLDEVLFGKELAIRVIRMGILS